MLKTAESPTQEFSPAEIGAIAHLYRGEIYRSTIWRTRLDNTTNWSIVTLGIALSSTYSAEATNLPDRSPAPSRSPAPPFPSIFACSAVPAWFASTASAATASTALIPSLYALSITGSTTTAPSGPRNSPT